MGRFAAGSDRDYLSRQYRDASNINARIAIHLRFSTNRYGWMRWVFDRLTLPPECRILEAGCGPGGLWSENAERIPRGWEVTLTDASPGMLEEARENLKAAGRPFRFATADAQSIPFPEGAFDAVIANHMLYHVPDRAGALGEIRRVLRPGGRLFASTVGRAHMREMADLVSGFDPSLEAWGSGNLAAETFTLENGGAQLAPLFADVTLSRYEDSLAVSESAPLVAYILSGRIALDGSRRAALAQYVERERVRHGGMIRITKDSGLFEAVRG